MRKRGLPASIRSGGGVEEPTKDEFLLMTPLWGPVNDLFLLMTPLGNQGHIATS